MPKLRYWKQTLIAWLLLRHCFLVAYSAQIEHTEADISSKPHHALHQNPSHGDPIHTFNAPILDSIDCELFNFHLADNQLSKIIATLNPTPDEDNDAPIRHITNPIKQLFTSILDNIDCEIRGFGIADLLLTNAITMLELVCDEEDDAPSKEPPHVPTPPTQYK
jgi:hypothetical protein